MRSKLSFPIGYRHPSTTAISPAISLLLHADSPSHYWLKWHLSAFSNRALLQSIASPWQQNMVKIQGYMHGLYHTCEPLSDESRNMASGRKQHEKKHTVAICAPHVSNRVTFRSKYFSHRFTFPFDLWHKYNLGCMRVGVIVPLAL